jgi:hypothetical protein
MSPSLHSTKPSNPCSAGTLDRQHLFEQGVGIRRVRHDERAELDGHSSSGPGSTPTARVARGVEPVLGPAAVEQLVFLFDERFDVV